MFVFHTGYSNRQFPRYIYTRKKVKHARSSRNRLNLRNKNVIKIGKKRRSRRKSFNRL
jgi:hypothetical protein